LSVPTHVAGTFLIHADASFLNGAGLGEGENRNVTIPKTLKDNKNDVPYVSSQAWKRWLRTTVLEETGWPPSQLKADKQSEKGSTSKISGELDPVTFPEDDLFGYMRAQAKKKARRRLREPKPLCAHPPSWHPCWFRYARLAGAAGTKDLST
jgi:CRISPR-associated protein Cst2